MSSLLHEYETKIDALRSFNPTAKGAKQQRAKLLHAPQLAQRILVGFVACKDSDGAPAAGGWS